MMKKLVISMVLVNLLAGCSWFGSGVKTSDAANTSAAGTTAAEGTKSDANTSAANGSGLNSSSFNDAAAAAKAANAAKNQDALNDANGILAKRSVYYGFDVDAVSDADKSLVQAHAKYLSEHADRQVTLAGYADERGSNEYNLALGQRRADGVKKMLELGGAKAKQLNSVSFGEEKPKAVGHNEAAWSQNRRTDLNYAK
jgi:peptidoglycan-associated lipoprotein